MGKVGRILNQKASDLRWSVRKKAWEGVELPTESAPPTSELCCFGITTYKERFEPYLQPLVRKLVYLMPECQIVIAVNGYHDLEQQDVFLEQITKWAEPFQNVQLVTFREPEGLCKLWNQILIHSKSDRVFIFNEDIQISRNFREEILPVAQAEDDFTLINGSYSHFVLNKQLIKETGWFDERFPGIGYEDHDFEIRLTLAGHSVNHAEVDAIKNENVVPEDWSYGDQQGVILTKYSQPNEVHYFKKWDFSEEQKPDYTYVRIIQGYAKLNPGMETPDFYPEVEL